MIWRVGRHLGRTIYAQVGEEPSDADELLGMMDTVELAERVVQDHNAAEGQ
jgi:hypothetical protein